MSIRRGAVRLADTECPTKGETHVHEHRPTSPRAARAARAGLPGVPRRRRDGQMAAAERLHRQGPPAWTPRSAAPTRCRSRTSPPATATPSAASTSSSSPHERIRYTDKFDDPNLPGEMQTTVTLKKVSVRHRAEHRAGRHPGRRSRPRRAISAGRNRSRCWRSSSRPRFRTERDPSIRSAPFDY